jgi:N-acetylglucosamine kinase-like BadF-type ATPase
MAAAEARIGPIRDVPRLINSSPAPIAAVAQFADAVAETARSGDPVSSAIFARAGEYIGRAIVAAARRAGLASPVPYTLIGGIATAADQFDAALTAYLSARLGVCLRQAPAGDGLDGAVALAGVARIENFSGLASVSQVG